MRTPGNWFISSNNIEARRPDRRCPICNDILPPDDVRCPKHMATPSDYSTYTVAQRVNNPCDRRALAAVPQLIAAIHDLRGMMGGEPPEALVSGPDDESAVEFNRATDSRWEEIGALIEDLDTVQPSKDTVSEGKPPPKFKCEADGTHMIRCTADGFCKVCFCR